MEGKIITHRLTEVTTVPLVANNKELYFHFSACVNRHIIVCEWVIVFVYRTVCVCVRVGEKAIQLLWKRNNACSKQWKCLTETQFLPVRNNRWRNIDNCCNLLLFKHWPYTTRLGAPVRATLLHWLWSSKQQLYLIKQRNWTVFLCAEEAVLFIVGRCTFLFSHL